MTRLINRARGTRCSNRATTRVAPTSGNVGGCRLCAPLQRYDFGRCSNPSDLLKRSTRTASGATNSLPVAVTHAIRHLAKLGALGARLRPAAGKRLAVRQLLGSPDSPTGARGPGLGIHCGRDALVAKRDDYFAAGFGIGI